MDDDIKQIIEAIKKAQGDPRQIREEAQSRAKNLAQIAKTSKEFERLEKIIIRQAKETKDFTDSELKEITKAFQDVGHEIYKLERVFGKGAAIAKKYAEQTGISTDKLVEQGETVSKVTDTIAGLGSAAYKGAGSISEFTDNFKNLGVFGSAIAGVGNTLDTNIEVFRQLASSGASFGQSIVGLRIAAGEARLPLDDFAALVKANSENLAALFGTTSEGARQVGILASQLRTNAIPQLAPLGFTIDELNETLLLNLERQRRTFNFDRNATETNINSAIEFAFQLDRLSKLTGQQREQLRSTIESQQSNERFQAFLTTQTDETRKRLELFAAAIQNEAPELAEGIQDLIANGGRAVTDASISLVQNAKELGPLIRDLTAGNINELQAFKNIIGISGNSVRRFNRATVTGTVDFLALQSGFIKLATRSADVDKAFAEATAGSTRLTGGLTTFEEAAKNISSQFQKVETSLLSAFGPALGGLAQFTQAGMKFFANSAAILAQFPTVAATALGGILVGKVLFGPAAQILIITEGVRRGMLAAGGGGGMFGGVGKTARGAGRFLARGAGALSVGTGLLYGGSQAMSDDAKTQKEGIGRMIGTGIGALGFISKPLLGTLTTMVGSEIGAQIGKRFPAGSGNVSANTVLVNDGPRREYAMTTMGASKILTDIQTGNQIAMATPDLNLSPVVSQMTMLNNTLSSADNKLQEMIKGVNTLVGYSETTARATKRTADRNGPYGAEIQVA
jgi:hypothetical protein